MLNNFNKIALVVVFSLSLSANAQPSDEPQVTVPTYIDPSSPDLTVTKLRMENVRIPGSGGASESKESFSVCFKDSKLCEVVGFNSKKTDQTRGQLLVLIDNLKDYNSKNPTNKRYLAIDDQGNFSAVDVKDAMKNIAPLSQRIMELEKEVADLKARCSRTKNSPTDEAATH